MLFPACYLLNFYDILLDFYLLFHFISSTTFVNYLAEVIFAYCAYFCNIYCYTLTAVHNSNFLISFLCLMQLFSEFSRLTSKNAVDCMQSFLDKYGKSLVKMLHGSRGSRPMPTLLDEQLRALEKSKTEEQKRGQSSIHINIKTAVYTNDS